MYDDTCTTFPLETGGYIIIDKKDEDWIAENHWITVVKTTHQGNKVFIVRQHNPNEHLHYEFFRKVGKHRSNYKIKHFNNDPFDFRRSNLQFILYHNKRRKNPNSTRKVAETFVSGQYSELGIIINKVVIARTNKPFRELHCVFCSMQESNEDLVRYENCLMVAAKYNYKGWKRIYWDEGLSTCPSITDEFIQECDFPINIDDNGDDNEIEEND